MNYQFIKEQLQTTLRQFKRGQISLREAKDLYNIPRSTLQRHARQKPKKHGGQTILSEGEEIRLVQLVVLAGKWGYPVEKIDIRYIVKGYLDRKGIRVAKFKNNMPGPDWTNLFYSRHRELLTERMCENIKRSPAAVSREIINKYFDNLQENLQNVKSKSIINYDETCFVDNPRRKKVIVKRKTRHPERIIDSTLDVSVFGPMKTAWRSALQDWKKIQGFFAEGIFSKFTKSCCKQIRNFKSKY
ncbi:hypothetical protein NQ314_017757 [Rhamnusium bicolor]|uniref:HTH psq-type domain-containing protein n=1 Tax=Rhamnusium bicolor TaxID=1586634 RepID=A0AAV8WS01_9CUCU|nr:hypothetical protein NQ314_017757 [Rhamnusium bicolor]